MLDFSIDFLLDSSLVFGFIPYLFSLLSCLISLYISLVFVRLTLASIIADVSLYVLNCLSFPLEFVIDFSLDVLLYF